MGILFQEGEGSLGRQPSYLTQTQPTGATTAGLPTKALTGIRGSKTSPTQKGKRKKGRQQYDKTALDSLCGKKNFFLRTVSPSNHIEHLLVT